MAHRPRLTFALAAAAASIVVLAGCASPAASEGDGRIAVVASTSVYGQIAEEIGGDLVDVTSIISSAGQDPHSFEPSAKDQLAVRHADLVIENGAGYDAFMDALIEASGSRAPVLTAAEFSSEWTGDSAEDSDGHHDHGDEHIEGFNEHVWYDLVAMGALAHGIQAKLEALSPDDADTFTANLDTFLAGIDERAKELSAMDAAHGGAGIFVTEPVPLYLTGAAGLVNLAPEAFTEAVEEGQDVAPATLYEALELLRSGDVKLLIANSQTGGAETALVIAEAGKRSIPVLEFSETLPAGKTYLSWMQANIDALNEGLGA